MAEGKFDIRGDNTMYRTSVYTRIKLYGPINVLGIKWDYENDFLFVNLDCIKDFECTINKNKIKVLSVHCLEK